MADLTKSRPENVVGQYYVDDQCIDCDVCRVEAPNHFTRQNDYGYSYVFAQPTSPEEIEKCEEALNACPVEAIGRDGAAASTAPSAMDTVQVSA